MGILWLQVLAVLANDYTIFKQNGKMGIQNADGTIIIEAIYDSLGWSDQYSSPFQDYVGVFQDQQWRLLNLKNRKTIEQTYDFLAPLEYGDFMVGQRSIISGQLFYGTISPTGKIRINPQFSSIQPTQNQLLVSQSGLTGPTLYGVIDVQGRSIISLKYELLEPITPQLWYGLTSEGKGHFLRKDGTLIANTDDPRYEVIKNGYVVYYQENLAGLIDPDGLIKIKPSYESIKIDENGRILAYPVGRWKVENSERQPLFDVKATSIEVINQNLLFYKNGPTGHLINKQGKRLIEQPLTLVHPLDSTHLLISNGTKYGVIKLSGTALFPLEYDSIVHENTFFALKKESGWFLYNRFGRRLTNDPFNLIKTKGEILFPVQKDGKWGYLDFNGNIAIACQYDQAYPFKYARAIVKQAELYGVINAFGQWLIPPQYREITMINKGLYLTQKQDRKLLLNDRHDVVFETYNQLTPHSFGLLEIDEKGKKGLINKYGRPVFGLKYDSISELLDDNYYILISKNYYSLIDKLGKVIIPEYSQFQKIFPFKGEFIGIQKDGKYGYIDRNNKLRIANQYEYVGTWSEGLGPVMLRGKWGFVDRLERLVVQPYYDQVTPFEDGITIVEKDGLFGLVDTQGRELLPLAYHEIIRLESGYFILRKDNTYGLAGKDGRITLQPQYQALSELSPGQFKVKRNNKWGIKDAYNVDLLPISYENVDYHPAIFMIKESAQPQIITLN